MDVRKPQSMAGSAKAFLISCTKEFIEAQPLPPKDPALSIRISDCDSAVTSWLAGTLGLGLVSQNATCILLDLFSMCAPG